MYTKKCFFSIIMPVYNSEKTIEHAINSVLGQSFDDFELIIINDGSTDNSLQLCRNFSDYRIHLIDKTNGGPSSARNKGLDKVSGEYLIFLDSDDFFETNALCILADYIRSCPVDLYIYEWNVVDRRENSDNIYKAVFSKKEINCNYEQVYNNIIISSTLCGGGYPWNKAWKVDAIRRNGEFIYFDETIHLYEDKLWIVQNLMRVQTIKFVDEIIYNYVRSNSSITARPNDKKRIEDLFECCRAATKIRDYVIKNHKSAIKAAECFEWQQCCNYLVEAKRQGVNAYDDSNYMTVRSVYERKKFCWISLRSTLSYIKRIFLNKI